MQTRPRLSAPVPYPKQETYAIEESGTFKQEDFDKLKTDLRENYGWKGYIPPAKFIPRKGQEGRRDTLILSQVEDEPGNIFSLWKLAGVALVLWIGFLFLIWCVKHYS